MPTSKGKTGLTWLCFKSPLHPLENGLRLSLVYFVYLEYSKSGILCFKELARNSLPLRRGGKAIAVVSTNLVGFKCNSLYSYADAIWMQPCLHSALHTHLLSGGGRKNLWQWKNVNCWHSQCISPHLLFVTPQTLGNFNGKVLLSEILAKP